MTLKQDVKTFGVQNITTVGIRTVVNTGKGKMDTDLKKLRIRQRVVSVALPHLTGTMLSFRLLKISMEALWALEVIPSGGKFDGKSDEDQPNVSGTGPNWMFDLDFLTNSMNYIPVSVENQVNMDADVADKERQHQMTEDEQVLHDDLEKMIAQEVGDPKFSCSTRGKIQKALHVQTALILEFGMSTLSSFLMENGSGEKSMCTEFEDCMHKRFQMSSMGELTFFLGLQVKQQPDGIFISQDKYVADILMKFDFWSIKTVYLSIESNKPLVKDEDGVWNVTPLFESMLVQPTKDEGEASKRQSKPHPTPSPPYPSADQYETQPDPSPRPSPTIPILDSILEGSGGNHRDQAKEIKHLKAHIKKLKKKAKPVITHHQAWMKSVSMKQRLAGKKSLKIKWMQKKSVSTKGRKPAKAEPTVHKDLAFDDLDDIMDDAMDYIESEEAQDEGRTSFVMLEEKESTQNGVTTEVEISTVKPDKGTDKSKVSTDKPEVSTAKPKEVEVSTDKLNEGTAEPKDGTSDESTTPTTVFRDDETIAEFLIDQGLHQTSLGLTLMPLPIKIDTKDNGQIRKYLRKKADGSRMLESEGVVDEVKENLVRNLVAIVNEFTSLQASNLRGNIKDRNRVGIYTMVRKSGSLGGYRTEVQNYSRNRQRGKEKKRIQTKRSNKNGPTPHPMITDPPTIDSAAVPATMEKLDLKFCEEPHEPNAYKDFKKLEQSTSIVDPWCLCSCTPPSANLLFHHPQLLISPTNNQFRTSPNLRIMLRCMWGHIVSEPVQRKAHSNVVIQCNRTQEKDGLSSSLKIKRTDGSLRETEMCQSWVHMESDVDEGPNAAVAFMANLSSTSATKTIMSMATRRSVRLTMTETEIDDKSTPLSSSLRKLVLYDADTLLHPNSLTLRIYLVISGGNWRSANEIASQASKSPHWTQATTIFLSGLCFVIEIWLVRFLRTKDENSQLIEKFSVEDSTSLNAKLFASSELILETETALSKDGNELLWEAARTMLILLKAQCFYAAEAVATAYGLSLFKPVQPSNSTNGFCAKQYRTRYLMLYIRTQRSSLVKGPEQPSVPPSKKQITTGYCSCCPPGTPEYCNRFTFHISHLSIGAPAVSEKPLAASNTYHTGHYWRLWRRIEEQSSVSGEWLSSGSLEFKSLQSPEAIFYQPSIYAQEILKMFWFFDSCTPLDHSDGGASQLDETIREKAIDPTRFRDADYAGCHDTLTRRSSRLASGFSSIFLGHLAV
ncbi:retrovirus-related pol polyprotein from transposon TNT 1-94 [Tanacetum coccineum]